MIVITPTTTIDEVIEMLRCLSAVAHQILDDVDDAVEGGDLDLLLERMVANAEDLQRALTSPQRVAQDTLQGETHD